VDQPPQAELKHTCFPAADDLQWEREKGRLKKVSEKPFKSVYYPFSTTMMVYRKQKIRRFAPSSP
jgi:hypothetical protein